MTILNPDHLLDQAEQLAGVTLGRPKQADLRRAISTAYYAVFHAILNAAGDQIAGIGYRGGSDYALVVRSIDHSTVKRVCVDIRKSLPPPGYLPYLPVAGFDRALQQVCGGFPTLQERRHAADYDVSLNVSVSDARSAIELATAILRAWRQADPGSRRLFILLILFPPKR